MLTIVEIKKKIRKKKHFWVVVNNLEETSVGSGLAG